MNRQYWLWLFVADLSLELVAIAYQQHWLRYITKPLLLVFLLAHFLQNNQASGSLKLFILCALIFSWAGDVFLLVEDKNPDFFIAGLASFLLAHLFYIAYFLRWRKKNKPSKPWHIVIVLLVFVYALGLFFFLAPKLGALQLPVLLYALTIATMLICSVHAYRLKEQRFGWWCFMGALLFVLSDSMLALNKFHQPFASANLLIMLTYALAQCAIVTGALKSDSKHEEEPSLITEKETATVTTNG